MNKHKRQPRGMTAVLAMLYLVLFSSLALGFYAATTTSSQIAGTDQQVANAYMAAESGMDFMRHTLSRVSIPTHTPNNQVISSLYTNLRAQLNGTGNLGAQSITLNGNTIEVPG